VGGDVPHKCVGPSLPMIRRCGRERGTCVGASWANMPSEAARARAAVGWRAVLGIHRMCSSGRRGMTLGRDRLVAKR
jgi:hypothetical protein